MAKCAGAIIVITAVGIWYRMHGHMVDFCIVFFLFFCLLYCFFSVFVLCILCFLCPPSLFSPLYWHASSFFGVMVRSSLGLGHLCELGFLNASLLVQPHYHHLFEHLTVSLLVVSYHLDQPVTSCSLCSCFSAAFLGSIPPSAASIASITATSPFNNNQLVSFF